MTKMDRLYCISENCWDTSQLEKIKQYLEAGGSILQVRLKGVTKDVHIDFSRKVKDLCDQYSALLIINDHDDVALHVKASGVHIGMNDEVPADVRKRTGKGFIIGGTANTFQQICKIYDDVDYIGLGPYRYTTTKKKLSPVLGISGLFDVMALYKKAGMIKPVYAIGGVVADDVPDILESGVYGVAVSGSVLKQQNIHDSVIQFRRKLNMIGLCKN